MKYLTLSLLTLFSFALINNSVAEESGKEIEITSDTAEHNAANATLTYAGHVVIRHTGVVINADELVIEEKPDGGHIAHVNGAPVTFSQVAENGKTTSGEAREGHYDIDLEILKLRNNARVTQDGNTISGDAISVNLKTGIATAGNQSSSGRVRTVIKSGTPKK